MAIELHHLNTHGMMEQACDVLDGVVRLKERIAELEKENAELKEQYRDMDVTHTVHIAKMNGYISHLEEERRWRKFPDEKPTEEMEGMDFIVSNGFFHREISEWRGYWNNDPFCGDRHCDEVKYWRPLPSEPNEDK